MLQLKNAARQYAGHTVFAGVSLTLRPGERLGLIGENGSGKTTLLRVLAGLDKPDVGSVMLTGRVAYLAQHREEQSKQTVLAAVTPPALQAARASFEAALAALSEATDAALMAFARAEETYRALGGYDFAARAEAVLLGLGLEAAAQPKQLSGGQLRRVMLARLLLEQAEVYLLDEPTNHLDAQGAQWLERWIVQSDAAFVLASHDRAFLDAVATRTAELERGELHLYAGNYSQATQQKETLRAAQQRDYEAYRRKKQALEEERQRQASKARSAAQFNQSRAPDNDKFVTRSKAQNVQNVSANVAKNLQKQIERLEAQAATKPYQDNRALHLDLPPIPAGPSEVLCVRGLGVQRGGQQVISGLDMHLRRGEKVALTGPNGAGKSTLLSALLGQLPYSGELIWGQGLSLYTLGQHAEELRGLGTVADALLDANPLLTPHQLHEVAAQLGLPGPAAPLGTLSGGQRTRLSLARLGVTRAQVLLLDEPTNHLDIHAITLLEVVLRGYAGTVLLATHDRRLIERVCTREERLGKERLGKRAVAFPKP